MGTLTPPAPPSVPAAQLGLRFVLELAALAGVAAGAAHLAGGGTLGIVAGALALVAAATLWGVFNVPGDPSRSGQAPVAVAGAWRLGLELVVLLGGAAGFSLARRPLVAALLAAAVVVHYLATWARVAWLVRTPRSAPVK